VHVPGFTTLIYYGGLDTIEFPVNIPCSDESNNRGDCDQRVTRYTLKSRLLCRITN